MATGALIDRADIQTGAAADAVQSLTPDDIAEHVGTTIVKQDQMKLLRPVIRAHTGPERSVGIHALAGRGAWQELQKHLEVLPGRDDFFNAHDRDQHTWQRDAHASVPL